jgi:hypothetical protein
MALDIKSLGKQEVPVKKKVDKDRVKVKVVNLQHPGQDIFIGDNDENYIIQDQKVVNIPISVYNGLLECKYTEYFVEGNADKGQSIKHKETSRFFVTKLNDSEEDEEDFDDLKANEDID